ncbi:MAG: PEP-CTERM sorting domain-containing protein [Sedimentisphaerales bacterium]|jgi:hypothetical protein
MILIWKVAKKMMIKIKTVILPVIILFLFISADAVFAAGFQGLGTSSSVKISGNGNVLYTNNSYYTASQGWQSFPTGFGASSVSPDGSTFVGGVTIETVVESPVDPPLDPLQTVNYTAAAAKWSPSSGIQQLNFPTTTWSSPGFEYEYHSVTTATGVSANGSTILGKNGNSSSAMYLNGSGSAQYIDENHSYAPAVSALAVSANGNTIAGYGYNGTGSDSAYIWRADSGITNITSFTYDNSKPPDVIGINPWDPPDEKVSSGMCMSSDGSRIIGSTGKRAFLWDQSTGLQWIQADSFQNVVEFTPYAASADGSVFAGLLIYDKYYGSYNNGQYTITLVETVNTAVIWDAINGVRNLSEVLQSQYGLDLSGWTLTKATGISDDGTVIIGTGTNPQGNTEEWMVTIPEPTTILLIGLGGLVLRKFKK